MKYIKLLTYNQEYLGKVPGKRVYFNPDNSVAIFEDQDERVLQYVLEHVEKLRNQNFTMNQTNYEKILDFLNSPQDIVEPQTEEKEITIEEKLNILEEKPSLKGVISFLKEFVKAK